MARELVAGELAKTLCGSPLYMVCTKPSKSLIFEPIRRDSQLCVSPPQAPEVLNRQKYTDKADLWSVGVIMYRYVNTRASLTNENGW